MQDTGQERNSKAREPSKPKVLWNRLLSWLGLHKAFFTAKSVHIFLFIVVNIFIGSLGVWMPLMTVLFGEDAHLAPALSAALAASGPYTFAVAYLAASSSYIAYEFLENGTSPNRKIKTVCVTTAFVLIILCTLLSAFQTLQARLLSLPEHQNNLIALGEKMAAPAADGTIPSNDDRRQWNPSQAELWQLWLVAISVLVGLALYVLSRWDDGDCTRLVEEYEKSVAAGATLLSDKARANNQPIDDLKF